MLEIETNALEKFNRTHPNISRNKLLEHFGEDVGRLLNAIDANDNDNVVLEMSRVATVLLHLLSKHDTNKIGLIGCLELYAPAKWKLGTPDK